MIHDNDEFDPVTFEETKKEYLHAIKKKYSQDKTIKKDFRVVRLLQVTLNHLGLI